MNAVDTNVLIYLSDTRDQRKRDKSREMVSASVPPVIVWQVASEFIAAARKLKAFGFTQEQAWLQLDQLLRVCPLALPTEHVLARAREPSQVTSCRTGTPCFMPRASRRA